MRRTAWALSLSLAIACGGRGAIGTMEDGDAVDDSDTRGDDVEVEMPANRPGAPTARDRTPPMTPQMTPLPPCELGPTRSEARRAGVRCRWLFEDRCYEERIAACACACPRDRNSTCVSGQQDTAVRVRCY